MSLQVEMRKESDYYPRVVASPSDGKVTKEMSLNDTSLNKS